MFNLWFKKLRRASYTESFCSFEKLICCISIQKAPKICVFCNCFPTCAWINEPTLEPVDSIRFNRAIHNHNIDMHGCFIEKSTKNLNNCKSCTYKINKSYGHNHASSRGRNRKRSKNGIEKRANSAKNGKYKLNFQLKIDFVTIRNLPPPPPLLLHLLDVWLNHIGLQGTTPPPHFFAPSAGCMVKPWKETGIKSNKQIKWICVELKIKKIEIK